MGRNKNVLRSNRRFQDQWRSEVTQLSLKKVVRVILLPSIEKGFETFFSVQLLQMDLFEKDQPFMNIQPPLREQRVNWKGQNFSHHYLSLTRIFL